MRRRIQKSMILVIFTTLLISYAVMTAVVYRQTVDLLEDETRQEADYILSLIHI